MRHEHIFAFNGYFEYPSVAYQHRHKTDTPDLRSRHYWVACVEFELKMLSSPQLAQS